MYSLVDNEDKIEQRIKEGLAEVRKRQDAQISDQVEKTRERLSQTNHDLRDAISTILFLCEKQGKKLEEIDNKHTSIQEGLKKQSDEMSLMRKRLIGEPEFGITGIVGTIELLKVELAEVKSIATGTKVKVYIISTAIGITASVLTFLVSMWAKLPLK